LLSLAESEQLDRIIPALALLAIIGVVYLFASRPTAGPSSSPAMAGLFTAANAPWLGVIVLFLLVSAFLSWKRD